MNVKDMGWSRVLEKKMRSSRAVTAEGEKGAESHAWRQKILFHGPEKA